MSFQILLNIKSVEFNKTPCNTPQSVCHDLAARLSVCTTADSNNAETPSTTGYPETPSSSNQEAVAFANKRNLCLELKRTDVKKPVRRSLTVGGSAQDEYCFPEDAIEEEEDYFSNKSGCSDNEDNACPAIAEEEEEEIPAHQASSKSFVSAQSSKKSFATARAETLHLFDLLGEMTPPPSDQVETIVEEEPQPEESQEACRFGMDNAGEETPIEQRMPHPDELPVAPTVIATPAPEEPAPLLTHQPSVSLLAHQNSLMSQGSGILQHQNSLMSQNSSLLQTQNSGLLSHQGSGLLQTQNSLMSQNSGVISHQGSCNDLLLPIASANSSRRPSVSIQDGQVVAAPLSMDLQTAQQQVMEVQAALAQMTLQHSQSQQNITVPSNPNSRRPSTNALLNPSNSMQSNGSGNELPAQSLSLSNLQVASCPEIDRRPSVCSNISNVSGAIQIVPNMSESNVNQQQQQAPLSSMMPPMAMPMMTPVDQNGNPMQMMQPV